MIGRFALQQDLGDRADVGGIGCRAERRHRRVVELALDVAIADLGGQLDQDRTGLSRSQVVERAPHQLEHPAGLADLGRPFGDRPEILHGVERGWRKASSDAVAGDQQHRDVVAEHLGNTGKGVLDARPALHREHAGALAVGRAADAVGDPDADALLPAYDRPDAGLGTEIDQGLARIADEMLDPFRLENARDGFGNFHVGILNDR